MLAKKYRLPIHKSLGLRGAVVRSRYFICRTLPSSAPHSRVGVVISKKVSPLATQRNLLKRLVFSLYTPAQLIKEQPPQDRIITLLPLYDRANEKHAMIEELKKLL